MKKLFITLAVIFAYVSASTAQDDVFQKGDVVIHAGVGLGSYLGGTGYKSTLPPIIISGEYGLTDALIKKTGKGYVGVGGYLAYSANKYEIGTYDNDKYGWKYSYIIVGARGAFHYQFIPKLDTYAGVMLGYNIASSSYYGYSGYTGTASSAGGFAYSGFAGARYYFSDKLAVFAEVGYGIAALELGIALKF